MNAEKQEAPSVPPVSVYRSAADVRVLQRLSLALLVHSGLLVASLAVMVAALWRPARQVIIERSAEGDQVIAINGQVVKSGFTVGEDKPGAGDKKTLAREWATARYAIDPLTRERDIERMFRMMEPNAAAAYSGVMQQGNVLAQEVTGKWQATWTPQLTEIDKTDPYLLHVMGLWEITKSGGKGGTEKETRQLVFKLHLRRDDRGRASRNLQTSFLIDDILDYRELPVENGAASALKTQ